MNILVVAPHPDDETLGCGGTILKHRAHGDVIFWLIMTKMTASAGYGEEQMRKRVQEIEAVSQAYGFQTLFPLEFAATTLDTIPRRTLISRVSTVVDAVKPEVVYIPNRSDIHSDHRVTFDVAMSALKTFRAPSVKSIVSYEVLSETDGAVPFPTDAFTPNRYSDISNYLEKKIEVMRMYKGELGLPPFPRSEENIRALAVVRGSTAGVRYAEAFMVIRDIV